MARLERRTATDVTAATLLALTTRVSFAEEGKPDNDERFEHAGKHRFCHYWEEYLERYGETAYFEKKHREEVQPPVPPA
jgi:hypothetical protein